MSSEHLTIGSKAPPLVPGKLRLYSMRYCPFAQRVHLILNAKKVPYDTVYISISEKPEWYKEKNPLGVVPALELEDGNILSESLIVADYLDETYPEHRFHSDNPLQKAKDRMLIERFNPVISTLFKIIYNTTGMESEWFEEVLNYLEIYEKELVMRGTPYFGGKNPGMLDLMIWPWFERIELTRVIKGDQFTLPQDRFVQLLEWRSVLKKTLAGQGSHFDLEAHVKYTRSRQSGAPQYEFSSNNDQCAFPRKK